MILSTFLRFEKTLRSLACAPPHRDDQLTLARSVASPYHETALAARWAPRRFWPLTVPNKTRKVKLTRSGGERATLSTNDRHDASRCAALSCADSSTGSCPHARSTPRTSTGDNQGAAQCHDWRPAGGATDGHVHALCPSDMRPERTGHHRVGLDVGHDRRTAGGARRRLDRPSRLCRSDSKSSREDYSSRMPHGNDWRLIVTQETVRW